MPLSLAGDNGGHRQPMVMALVEAGTWPVEVNGVRVGDIDLDVGWSILLGGQDRAAQRLVDRMGVLDVRQCLVALDSWEDPATCLRGQRPQQSRERRPPKPQLARRARGVRLMASRTRGIGTLNSTKPVAWSSSRWSAAKLICRPTRTAPTAGTGEARADTD